MRRLLVDSSMKLELNLSVHLEVTSIVRSRFNFRHDLGIDISQ